MHLFNGDMNIIWQNVDLDVVRVGFLFVFHIDSRDDIACGARRFVYNLVEDVDRWIYTRRNVRLKFNFIASRRKRTFARHMESRRTGGLGVMPSFPICTFTFAFATH